MEGRLTYLGKRAEIVGVCRQPATRDRSHREFAAIQGGFEGREKVAGHRGPRPLLRLWSASPHAGDRVPGTVAATFL